MLKKEKNETHNQEKVNSSRLQWFKNEQVKTLINMCKNLKKNDGYNE